MNRQNKAWALDVQDKRVSIGDTVAFASKMKGYGTSALRLAIGRVEAIWYDMDEQPSSVRITIRDHDPKRKVAQTRRSDEIAKVAGLEVYA